MKSKLYFIPVLIGLFTSCRQNEQQNAQPTDTVVQIPNRNRNITEPTAVDSLTFIKKEFQRINALPLDSVVYRFKCDENTVVKIYSENKQPVKVSIDWGSVGDAYNYEEFYYHQGKLIFEYDLLEGTGAFEGADFKRESRSYIKDDQVFLFTVNGKKEPCKTCVIGKTHKAYLVQHATTESVIRKVLCR